MKHITLVISSLFILLVSCNQFKVEESESETAVIQKIPNVSAKRLMLTSESVPIISVGTVAQREIQNLSFKTSGAIEQIFVKAAQNVRKGQLLAKIKTEESAAQLEKARTVFEKINRDLEKLEKMYADTAVTLTQLEDLQMKADLAKSDMELAEINVNNSKLFAPANGKILRKLIRQNEVISAGIPIFQFSASGQKSLVVKTSVTDKDIVQLHIGDKAKVTFDVFPNQVFDAYITQIAEAANPLTGTFDIELSFSTFPKKMIKSGFVCNVELLSKQVAPYFKIDLNALVEGAENAATIFLLKKDAEKTIAEKIMVKPDQIQNDFFRTSDTNLKEGQLVVTSGAAWLLDGMEVKVVEEN